MTKVNKLSTQILVKFSPFSNFSAKYYELDKLIHILYVLNKFLGESYNG
jgi:hypothetical protein